MTYICERRKKPIYKGETIIWVGNREIHPGCATKEEIVYLSRKDGEI